MRVTEEDFPFSWWIGYSSVARAKVIFSKPLRANVLAENDLRRCLRSGHTNSRRAGSAVRICGHHKAASERFIYTEGMSEDR